MNDHGTENPSRLIDDLCSPPTVATLLGLKTPSVYAAMKRSEGGLSHLRTPGGQFRVKRRNVLAFCHRTGHAIPEGLIPPGTRLVAVHPGREAARLLASALPDDLELEVHQNAVDGLLAIGERLPLLVLLSSGLGEPLIERLCDAVSTREEEFGYIGVVMLDRQVKTWWEGGAVPRPLRLPEPNRQNRLRLGSAIRQLLGLGPLRERKRRFG